jgi:hypothetical protein
MEMAAGEGIVFKFHYTFQSQSELYTVSKENDRVLAFWYLLLAFLYDDQSVILLLLYGSFKLSLPASHNLRGITSDI